MSKKILIELSSRRLYLQQNTTIMDSFPVAVGKPATPTPQGHFQVLNKIINPGGVLGTRWMQFTSRQHGIHGTNQPWLIGQAVSNGCVRMYNHNVEVLYDQVVIGTPVIIRDYFSISNNPEKYLIYTVKSGDSLWSIARKHRGNVEVIKKINSLKSTLIYPGQKLKIPLFQA